MYQYLEYLIYIGCEDINDRTDLFIWTKYFQITKSHQKCLQQLFKMATIMLQMVNQISSRGPDKSTSTW